MSTVVLIQARMDSARLPGKVLLPIGPLPAIAHTIQRAKLIGFPVWVCIPDTRPNDRLGAIAAEHGADIWRGAMDDVLGRLATCAAYVEASYVVRLTGDCPLVNPVLVQEVVGRTIAAQSLYGSNTEYRTYPRGLDVQVYDAHYLRRLNKMVTNNPAAREHVTPLFMEGRSVSVTQRQQHAHHRWVLDTPMDYRWFQCVASIFDMRPPTPSTSQLLEAIRRDPSLGWYEDQVPPNIEKGDDEGFSLAST